MAQLEEDSSWIDRWNEIRDAVQEVLGDTEPPNSVTPFSWKQFLLPGACAMNFNPTADRNDFLSMTLGITQLQQENQQTYPWEFSVRSYDLMEWPVDLLYQLTTQWLFEQGDIWFGYRLPLVFFKDKEDIMWAGLSDEITELNVIGAIRAMYFWTDEMNLRFSYSSGEFSLLTVVAVTEDEDRLAQETTPAHLILLMQCLGLSQVCDPFRQSVLSLPDADREWFRIRSMSHDAALDELQRK
ncbi:hypothetical protein [Gimesia sp.]|uniref:hypothetical protein n=1 Tax=Gimesia sp. TaxID=2024833 RepID=UPI003A919EBF